MYVTHGYKSVFASWLRESHKVNAVEVETLFEGEGIENESSGEDVEVAQNSTDKKEEAS